MPRIRDLAERTGLSVSQIVRRLLAAGLPGAERDPAVLLHAAGEG